jgi:rubrerythrin
MPRGVPTPSQWVQLVQALVAIELVEQMGVPERRAASLLGLTPSAISQYVTGSRRGEILERLSADPRAKATARRLAHFLVELPPGHPPSPRPLLEAAAKVSERMGEFPSLPGGGDSSPRISRVVTRKLRERIAAEQGAVSECMNLAQKAGDELTRAVFRQIASDSLRHAEIVASLVGYLESGVDRTFASGVTRADVEDLIRKESEAEQRAAVEIRKHVGGVMALLVESMEADERKHEELLKGLLARGFGD